MKKIMHLLSSNTLAGAEKLALEIIKNLSVSYEACYCSPPGPIQEILEAEKISFVPVSRMGVRELRSVMEQIKPDILHAHDYRASLAGSYAKGKTRLICHLHSNYAWTRRRNFKTLLFSAAIPRMDRIVAVSNAVLAEHACCQQMLPRTVVMENCVNLETIYGLQAVKPERNTDLLFVGRFIREKNPMVFIKCIEQMKNKGMNIKACMVGDGPQFEACQAALRQKGLEENIRMTGFQANPYQYLADAKLLLMPSRSEGFGMAAMEALSLGVPVLCSHTGGLKAIITEGSDGFFCNDIDHMVRSAEILLTNQEQWQEMSRHALQTAQTRNNMQNYMDSIEKLYE